MCLKLNGIFCDWVTHEKNEKLAKWGSLFAELWLLCLTDTDSFQLSLSVQKRWSPSLYLFIPTILVWLLSKTKSYACKIIDYLSCQSAKDKNPVFFKFIVSF